MIECKWNTHTEAFTLKRNIERSDIQHLIFNGWGDNHILADRNGRIWRYNFTWEDQERIMDLMAKIASENPHNLRWTPLRSGSDYRKPSVKAKMWLYKAMCFLGVYSFFRKH